MAYDYINVWSDIIEALRLDLKAEGVDANDLREVATLALDRIGELQRAEATARAMLVAMKYARADLNADQYVASVISDDLEEAIATAEAAGIKD